MHDAVSTLRLFIEFCGVLKFLRAGLRAGGEQLAVAENRGERIVEFVSYAGNQLTDGGHFIAMQQLFLRAAKIFVSLFGFVVEQRALNGAGDLAAHGDKQVDVSGRKFTRRAAADEQPPDHAILRPQNDDVSGSDTFLAVQIAQGVRQWQSMGRNEGGMHGVDMMQNIRSQRNGWNALGNFRAMAYRGDAAQRGTLLFEQIDAKNYRGRTVRAAGEECAARSRLNPSIR